MKSRSKPFDILGFRKAWKDIVNYRDWIRTIDKEEADDKSIYSRFNMGKNFFYNIYVIVTLRGEDVVLPEEIKRMRVTEALIPINRYLDEQLKFAEYLAPEFSNIEHDGEPTLNYLVVYRFYFHKLSWKWIITRSGIIGGLIWGGFQVPWINLGEWFLSLI